MKLPDARGRFGPFGGRYIPETLVPAFERLEEGVQRYLPDPGFQVAFKRELHEWVGRPTALTFAPRLSERWGTEVWLKREDLAHTGAHKINNAIGQALLAKRSAQTRHRRNRRRAARCCIRAACARVGLPCRVYMGAVDIERQAPNVDRMLRLGAEVFPVESGDKTLRAAIDEALRAWVADPEGIYYLLGPRWGRTRIRTWCVNCSRSSARKRAANAGTSRRAARCSVRLCRRRFKCDRAVLPAARRPRHAADRRRGRRHRQRPRAKRGNPRNGNARRIAGLLLDDSAGRRRTGAGNAFDIGRTRLFRALAPNTHCCSPLAGCNYITASDDEALAALEELCELEGILTALETAHAFAAAKRWSQDNPGKRILIGNSGRGDKDMPTLTQHPVRKTHQCSRMRKYPPR